jgi:C-terminal processing protease CtpA/Prc
MTIKYVSWGEAKVKLTWKPNKQKLEGKVIFLTNAAAISYSESILGIVECYNFAEIVGMPTAGANGNVNNIVLPSNREIVWTGMEVLKHDGSQHHLIGIQPDVLVKRTIEAVSEGRDEYIEEALRLINAPN